MCLLLKTMPNQQEALKQCLEAGLDIDNEHPTLLLLRAQTLSNKTLSMKYAKQALNAAQDRDWSTKAISAFIQRL